MAKKQKKFNKERVKAILWRVLWIVGMALLVGVSAVIAGAGVGGPAGAIIGGIIGTAIGAGIGVSIAMQKPLPPKEEEEQEAPPPSPKPITTPPPEPKPVLPTESISEPAPQTTRGRYVGNSHTHEIHDITNLTPACMFDTITEEHKETFNSLKEVEQAIASQGYDGCRWCMSQFNTD